jgi:hypothetical protein
MGEEAPHTAITLSRRRLFELGAGSVGLAALLAACGNEESAAPGGGGVAPALPTLPEAEVNDVVYLRTLSSLQHSLVTVYAALADLDGLDEQVAAMLTRFSDDNLAAASTIGELTREAGGEPYECENTWMMQRTLQPLVEHIVGVPDETSGTSVPAGAATSAPAESTGTSVPADDGWEIEPTDDPNRDSTAVANALETIAAATAQLFVERIADPALRAEVIREGTAASRRAAVSALRSNPPPDGYVSPALAGETVSANEAGFMPVFAINSRYGQLSAVQVTVGALDEEDLRYTINIETPAENAYIYEGMSCPA